MTGPGPHLDDELSALVDGELDAPVAARAHAHLEGCERCTAELEAVRDARRTLRSLPAVEPPAGFLDRLLAPDADPSLEGEPAPTLRRRRRRPAGLAAAAAAAAAVALLLGTGEVPADSVRPQLSGVVATHAATVQAVSVSPAVRPGGAVTTLTTAPVLSVDRLPSPYRASRQLTGGYRLVRAAQTDDGLQLFYQRAGYGLSVFEREGSPDWASLPEGGRWTEEDGESTWSLETEDGAGTVVVLARDGLTFTAVGDEPGDAVQRAVRSMPGPRPLPFATRLRRMCGDALETFSPLP